MNPRLIITLASREDPRTVSGYFDGSRAGFTTDRRRAKSFPTRREAWQALRELRQPFPSQAIRIQARLGQRMIGFAAGIALAAALGSCASPAEVQQREHLACQGYGFTSGTPEFSSCLLFVDQARLNRNAVEDASGPPPDPAQIPAMPDNRFRFFVPAGGGAFMELP
jgi:hypothetical protein